MARPIGGIGGRTTGSGMRTTGTGDQAANDARMNSLAAQTSST